MDTCDVLIVGGGPAGSACARRLRQAGLDVVVVDRAAFPRDKVCAGWITPQVVDDLELDCQEYARGRTLQPITGFRTGVIGCAGEVETAYERPVSFGIRRCEFDQYLLNRSGARLALGTPASSIRREGARWIVNDSIGADLLVGAGGHFCPVARWLNPTLDRAPLVVAQEAEFAIEPAETASWPAAAGVPELYFCRDLSGYGWCFRKQEYINIGFGLLGRGSLPQGTAQFVAFLRSRRRIPDVASWRWRGHAYLVAEQPRRRTIDNRVLLVGDAAGIAYPQSGEGIRPAIESGLLAASTIVAAQGRYSREQLEPYERSLQERFGPHGGRSAFSRTIVPAIASRLLPWLLNRRWFTRHLVLDRWFLNMHQPALTLR
jgi:geranylgeranyl reductase family protein